MPKKVFSYSYEIVQNADRAFGKFFVGQIIDSLIVGVVVFVILWLVKMPYYSVVSVLVCITNVIPYFGPFLGGIPSFIIIFISDPIKALWFIVIILIVQQIDGNIICPRIQSETVGLSSLWIIIAITVIGGLFGVVGMFIAVPLFSTIYTFAQRFVDNRLKKRNLPTDHASYDGVFSFSPPDSENSEGEKTNGTDKGDNASGDFLPTEEETNEEEGDVK